MRREQETAEDAEMLMQKARNNISVAMRNTWSRRVFLSTALAAPFAAGAADFQGSGYDVASPDRRVVLRLMKDDAGRLSYSITFGNRAVIETSAFGMSMDGEELCASVEAGAIERYRINERYAWRGNHSEAFNRCNGARLRLRRAQTGADFTLEVRVFNDGAAFRFIVPGAGGGKARAPDESTGFVIPEGSTLWHHDFEGHYEGIHARSEIAGVRAGEWAAPPLTIRLPRGGGYASITEAALIDYAGMGLQADGRRGFGVRLGHAHPASYPFRLRYAADVERLQHPAAIKGEITTPWRVVVIGADLDALVNSDIVHNLSPPPDPKLFPAGIKTGWVRPGRAVWKYLDGGENTLEEVKNFSLLAGRLGFEYQVVEGFWSRWSEAHLREAVEYSREQGVGLLLWKHSRDLRTKEARREFFELCRRVGAVGAKIDFFDHEAKEIIDLYQTTLRDAAGHGLMLNFHGANKPAGEARTWPNEMTREGIYGLEHRRTEAWAPINTTLPFTRMPAGHADYTPMHFGERRKETSWAHQIASAAIFTSPLLVYGAHPKNILANPAVEMIRSIPSVWDKTVVLPMSGIGELAAFARRRGDKWFLAIMNGAQARSIEVPLGFLGGGRYRALLVRDRQDEAAAVDIVRARLGRGDSLTIEMRGGGGFIGRFEK